MTIFKLRLPSFGKTFIYSFYKLNIPLIVLTFFILSTNCSPHRGLKIYDDLPQGAKKGFIEFYCFRCIAGFSIYRVENDKETFLAQLRLGKTVGASLDTPSRLKRLRFAHIPGEFEFEIKVYGFSSPHKFLLRVKINENILTPIRIKFSRVTSERIYFSFEEGRHIDHPQLLNELETLLLDASWQTRWYAVQVVGDLTESVPTNVINLVEYYSSESGFETCLQKFLGMECSELQAQAKNSLKKLKANQKNSVSRLG